MPSVQQLRWEAFADAVAGILYRGPFGMASSMPVQNLDVSVELEGGVRIDFRLFEVDLDRRELIGRSPSTGASVNLALSRVKAVWHHKRRTGRAMLIWFATFLACAAGGALGAAATGWGGAADGALIGAFLGSIAGIGVLKRFDTWRVLYQVVPMYDSAESI